MKTDTVILAVSNDKYELPIAIYLTTHEMSQRTGMSLCDCDIALQRKSYNRKQNCRFMRVKIEDEEQEH